MDDVKGTIQNLVAGKTVLVSVNGRSSLDQIARLMEPILRILNWQLGLERFPKREKIFWFPKRTRLLVAL
jgi:hypothetical protein